jgi:hypothetical protein
MRKSIGFLALAVAACGGGGSGGPATPLEQFASYWADTGEWCRYQDACGIVSAADCAATWPSRDDTRIAVQAIPPAELMACEAVSRMTDACVLKLPCEQFFTGCTAERMQFDTACGGAQMSLDAYVKAHPRVAFTGKFHGSYTGSESGSLSGEIYPSGAVGAQIDSPSLGFVNAGGAASNSGALSLSAKGTAMGGKYTITYSGTIKAATGAAFTGSGTWQSSSGYTGAWTLESD